MLKEIILIIFICLGLSIAIDFVSNKISHYLLKEDK